MVRTVIPSLTMVATAGLKNAHSPGDKANLQVAVVRSLAPHAGKQICVGGVQQEVQDHAVLPDTGP